MNWIGSKIFEIYTQIIPGGNSVVPRLGAPVSPGGVEYNPTLFQESVAMTSGLNERVSRLEKQSEYIKMFNDLKNDVKTISFETSASILQVYLVINQISVYLGQQIKHLKGQKNLLLQNNNPAQKSSDRTKLYAIDTQLRQAQSFKRQLQDFQRILMSKHMALKQKVDFLQKKKNGDPKTTLPLNSLN